MSSSRHFETPPLLPSPSRIPLGKEGSELIESIAQTCWKHYNRSPGRCGSLYAGALGAVAFLRWKVALYFLECAKEDTDAARQYQTRADRLLQEGLTACESSHSSSPRRCTLLESPFFGTLAVQSVILHSMKRHDQVEIVLQQLLDALSVVHQSLAPEECEVLYGRAGCLHTILFVRNYLSLPTYASQTVNALIHQILSAGIHRAKRSRSGLPLLWEWHGSEYLGAAHGVVGILYTLLCFENEIRILEEQHQKDYMGLIQTAIDVLGERCCFASGNLASSIGRESDRLVHWCHGSPGHVLLLVKASQVFQEERYLERAKTLCRNVIFPRGLLRKGLGLCHGISGNAYCFLSVYRTAAKENLDRKEWLDMAHHFAQFGLDHIGELEHVPDHPYSLYEGLAAFAALLVDLQNPDLSCFPFYEYNN